MNTAVPGTRSGAACARMSLQEQVERIRRARAAGRRGSAAPALPGRHQREDERRRPAAGTSRRAAILRTLAPKKARSTARKSGIVTSSADQRAQPQRWRATTYARIVVIAIVAVTAMPYAAARALDDSKAEHQADRGEHQQPVDPRDVDLPHLVRRGVHDLHARAVAELHRLPRQRERAGDQRLRRDDRRPASRARPAG